MALLLRPRDAEVLTMEIVGEYQGIATDKGIWQYFRHHWLGWFPKLPLSHELCATSREPGTIQGTVATARIRSDWEHLPRLYI